LPAGHCHPVRWLKVLLADFFERKTLLAGWLI
jgi:hypothetical protein